MKNKTLQEQYNLIKEGKGNETVFLREAKRQFPKLIRNAAGIEETASKLKAKSIISENYVDIQPIGDFTREKASWEDSFKNFIAEEKAIPSMDHNYENQDWKNLDNQIGTEVLKGIEFEAKKSPDKNIEEIKKIVSSNLNKDSLYYTKNTYAGIEGLGLKSMPSNEVTGKHAGSGYSEKLKTLVKESLMINEFVDEDLDEDLPAEEGDMPMDEKDDGLQGFDNEDDKENFYNDTDFVDEEETTNEITAEVEEEMEKESKGKDGKKKKMSVEAVLREIEKVGSRQALEAKCAAIDEEIAKREQKMSMVDENEDLSELVDAKVMKAMKKEIKVLERQKAKYEKALAKATK